MLLGLLHSGVKCYFQMNPVSSSSTCASAMLRGQLENVLTSGTLQIMKHPPSVMIWGAMLVTGTAGLFFLPNGMTMNGQKYIDLLKDKLKLHMNVHNCNIFMQDGTPYHRSKIVSEFLKEKKIKVLNWPGNSPDLNPIENLWEVLKNKVADKQPSSAKHLKDAIKEVWICELSSAYCRTLVESMPRRLEMVIKNNGGHTKY